VKTRRSPERELREAVAFALLKRIGCLAFREGVERFGSAAAAFRAHTDIEAKQNALSQAATTIARAREIGVAVLLQGEPGYPASLMDLPDPPPLLYALGDISLLDRCCVGIVGTRHASAAGERSAHRMAARLVDAGVVVVSGMAFGIDAAAHRGALDGGGGTIAVLGSGVDVPYPPSHATLHDRIARHGLVLSEAMIGTRPGRGAFPKRNRIIAALSETLVVIEAGDRSGALITSRQALDLGRTVAAVPGPIDSPRHIGSNRLLAEGASFVGSIDDVLSIAAIDPEPGGHEPAMTARESSDDPVRKRILEAVRSGATDVEDLARSTQLTPREFAHALSLLELNGMLHITDGGHVALAAN
jgi:DNA processing protein